MHKKSRSAFTLIEVMVAVMIISVVILALLEMFANNTHIFSQLNKQKKINQYASLLISNPNYGLESKSAHMDDLISDFKIDDDLRRELKSVKIEILYQKVAKIDMSKYKTKKSDEKEVDSNIIFEIGKTVLKTDDASTALLRLRVEP